MENTIYQNEMTNNINVDNAVSSLLSHFDSNYIMHIVDDSLGMRFRPFQAPMPNIVISYENTFKNMINELPGYTNNFLEARETTYKEIINYICNFYNLEFSESSDTLDYFTITNLLYSIFVSNFEYNLVSFFINFIIREKKNIYDFLIANEKNLPIKNSSASYNKKIYKNGKMAIIQSNIPIVLDTIIGGDISLEMLLNLIIEDKNVVQYILSCISDKGDIFKNYFATFLIDPNTKPALITEIKLRLHDISTDADKMSVY